MGDFDRPVGDDVRDGRHGRRIVGFRRGRPVHRDLSPPIVTLGGFSTAGPGFSGMFVVGAAPVVTATVRLQAGSAAPFEAVVGPPGPDSQHRYFGAFVDDVAGKVAAIALDAAGNEIAAQVRHGLQRLPVIARGEWCQVRVPCQTVTAAPPRSTRSGGASRHRTTPPRGTPDTR